MRTESRPPAPASTDTAYEPPMVEQVIDAEELSREVHYAGRDAISL